jgi:hypothetical protein
MRLHRRFHQSLAAVLAALALATPSALARPVEDAGAPKLTPVEEQYLNSHGIGAPRPVVQTPPAAPAVQATDAGFDWGAAAVGAAAAAGIIALISLGAPRLRVRIAP